MTAQRQPLWQQVNGSDQRPVWPEAEIIAEPLKGASDPRVLVRRRESLIVSPDNRTEYVYGTGPLAIRLRSSP